MKINKEQFKEIPGFDKRESFILMSDSELESFSNMCERFIDAFPALEEKVKASFKEEDNAGTASVLLQIKQLLTDINAGQLLKLCEKLLTEIENPSREAAEAALTYFLTTASMLSIEIQMAIYKEGDAASAARKPVGSADNRQRTILAVDDVSLLLATIRTFIQGSEYKFVGVTSGDAALKFVSGHETDLFLLDIDMPVMDGYELAAKLRRQGHNAPIIFLTGNAQSKYVMKAIQTGASDFIVKPASKEQVLQKIKKYIR